MIITRTPLRISLAGGGTDMPGFYKHMPGAVVSFAIDKYVYVAINPKFDGHVRVSYSKTENVTHPMDLKHDIIRESLLAAGVHGCEVVTMADIPGEGTGLGSSSALAVGLSKGLNAYKGNSDNRHPSVFAENAYTIEREQCLHAIGKQDHYAAAYGGLRKYEFYTDSVTPLPSLALDDKQKLELENRFVLLWTGQTRRGQDILQRQESIFESGMNATAEEMANLARLLWDELLRGDFSAIGHYLNDNWKRKKELVYGISNAWLDELYEKAIFAGAQGGKVCGAGGGGFFLFYGDFGLAPKLEQATGLKHVPFEIEMEGSKVIYGSNPDM